MQVGPGWVDPAQFHHLSQTAGTLVPPNPVAARTGTTTPPGRVKRRRRTGSRQRRPRHGGAKNVLAAGRDRRTQNSAKLARDLVFCGSCCCITCFCSCFLFVVLLYCSRCFHAAMWEPRLVAPVIRVFFLARSASSSSRDPRPVAPVISRRRSS